MPTKYPNSTLTVALTGLILDILLNYSSLLHKPNWLLFGYNHWQK